MLEDLFGMMVEAELQFIDPELHNAAVLQLLLARKGF
jgi:hypothetical protein